MWDTIVSAVSTHLLPLLPDIITYLVTALVGMVAWTAQRFFKVNIEEKDRERIVAAIRNFIIAAMTKDQEGRQVLGDVVPYLEKTLPDAMKRLKPTDEGLQTITRALMKEMGATRGLGPIGALVAGAASDAVFDAIRNRKPRE